MDLLTYALLLKKTGDSSGIDSATLTQAVADHNSSTTSHNDIRLLVEGLDNRLSALADSDDTTLDQLSEIVTYIKSNKSLIDAITTNKVSVSDIIDNLTTNSTKKPLSAAQGVVLKSLIDSIVIPTKLSELAADASHRLVTDTEKQTWNSKSDFSGSYNDLSDKPTIPSVEGLASETYVNNAVKDLVSTNALNTTLSGYAKTSDIPESYDDTDIQAKVADLIARVSTLEGASTA